MVSTSAGAVPGMLDAGSDQPSGWIVPPRDARDLAAALKEATDNPSLRRLFGGRAWAKGLRCYSLKAAFYRLLSLWREVAG